MEYMETTIGAWLLQKFLDWQSSTGRRSTLDDFATHLGIGRSTLSKWMNGNSRPAPEFIDQVAEKLGDEIYDLMGKPRPDPDLVYIIKNWGTLTTEQRREIREQAEEYSAGSNETNRHMAKSKT